MEVWRMPDTESTDEERQALADKLEREIRPLIHEVTFKGGYDCCGCSTYDKILDHAIAIVRGERYAGDVDG
jgi:hypothetical protein